MYVSVAMQLGIPLGILLLTWHLPRRVGVNELAVGFLEYNYGSGHIVVQISLDNLLHACTGILLQVSRYETW